MSICKGKIRPWFNDEIAQILSRKNELFKQFSSNGKLQNY